MYYSYTFMKTVRHPAILALIAAEPIGTQAQLKRRLARAGHRVDQATLSRDLRELGIAKVAENGGPARYRVVTAPAPVGPLVKGAEAAGNLVVVRTAPGDATRVGLKLDRAAWPEIAGTVAGDDTLLVVVRDGHKAARVAKKLLEVA